MKMTDKLFWAIMRDAINARKCRLFQIGVSGEYEP